MYLLQYGECTSLQHLILSGPFFKCHISDKKYIIHQKWRREEGWPGGVCSIGINKEQPLNNVKIFIFSTFLNSNTVLMNIILLGFQIRIIFRSLTYLKLLEMA